MAHLIAIDGRRAARTAASLHASIDAVDLAIAEAATPDDATAIADALAPIAAELMWLVTKARLRAEALIPAC